MDLIPSYVWDTCEPAAVPWAGRAVTPSAEQWRTESFGLVLSLQAHPSHIWLQVSAELLYFLSCLIISFPCDTWIHNPQFFAFGQGWMLLLRVFHAPAPKWSSGEETPWAAYTLFHTSDGMSMSHPGRASSRFSVNICFKASADTEGQQRK